MLTSAAITFGDLLRQLRKRRGMTQADLAAAVGYSIPFISNLELNQRLPNVEAVTRHFVPALGLQEEPELAARLVALAARGEEWATIAHPPAWPTPPTALIGREREIKAICNRLLGHSGRLLTLIGPPGLGKTRLALAVADKLHALFRDGAFFVPLAAIGDAELVTSAIASTLGIGESETGTPKAKLLAFLRRKQTLLILDNFEQILPAAPLVAELLAACPELYVLVTSRERLHLRAEQRFRVPSLDLTDAVALFMWRAQAVDPAFALTPDNQPALSELCERLDGLPLAIELCATRVDLLTPQDLLARLRDHRLDLLADGPQDLPNRQRTLRTAIDWSYRLLDAQERSLFRRLGVFVGGFAQETAADLGFDETALHALVHKSLVQVTAREDGTRRFELLETLREYAWEELCAAGEAVAIQHAHAATYLRLAEEAARRLRGPDQGVWLDRLAIEQANLRAALTFSLSSGQSDTAARLGIALWRYWYIRGPYEEGERWLKTLPAQTEQPEQRASLLYGRGMLARRQGDMAAAGDSLAAALALYRELDDPRGVASALRGLGFVYYLQDDEVGARAFLQEALAGFRALDDWEGIAVTLDNLGYISQDPIEEYRLYQESLALRRRSGNLRGVAMSLAGLAKLSISQGDYAAARRYAQEQLQISQTLGNQDGMANALDSLGEAAFGEGDYSAARLLYDESTQLCRKTGNRLLLPGVTLRLGLAMIKLGDYAQAQTCCEQALALFWERGSDARVVKILEVCADLALAQGRAQRALYLAGAAAALGDSLRQLRESPEYQAEIARIQTAACRMLRPEAAAAAWQAGQATTLDEAVTYALAVQPA